MQYGTAATRTTNRNGTGTMAHIIKMEGKALCGVKLDAYGGSMTSLAGWNLCMRCEIIQRMLARKQQAVQ